MAIPVDPKEKRAHRRRLRALLAAMGPAEAALQSARISEHLWEWLAERPGEVAAFSALPGEPALGFLRDGFPLRRFHYPLVDGGELRFHAVARPAELTAGAFGILEPHPDRDPPTPTEAIDIFLCPGLGFARDGTRLGRGQGYYDRTLARARPDALRVGVGFSIQSCRHLPSDPHDQRMTHLADEHGVREAVPDPGP